jgi:hypothetical protein
MEKKKKLTLTWAGSLIRGPFALSASSARLHSHTRVRPLPRGTQWLESSLPLASAIEPVAAIEPDEDMVRGEEIIRKL